MYVIKITKKRVYNEQIQRLKILDLYKRGQERNYSVGTNRKSVDIHPRIMHSLNMPI